MSDWIYGRNAVGEALRAGRRPVRRLLVSKGRIDRRLQEIVETARQAGIPVQRVEPQAIEAVSASDAVHQGIAAEVGHLKYADPEEVIAASRGTPLFVVLDGVEDPRNLGAVIRSAAAAGADGLFLPDRRSVGVTAVAVKAAAGAAEELPIARVGNVVAFLKRLKEKGIWVVGLDVNGAGLWGGFDMNQPLALILGGEGKGLRRLARETCDAVVSIPLCGGVESLNLSVAAGIALFEAVRQRRAANQNIF